MCTQLGAWHTAAALPLSAGCCGLSHGATALKQTAPRYCSLSASLVRGVACTLACGSVRICRSWCVQKSSAEPTPGPAGKSTEPTHEKSSERSACQAPPGGAASWFQPNSASEVTAEKTTAPPASAQAAQPTGAAADAICQLDAGVNLRTTPEPAVDLPMSFTQQQLHNAVVNRPQDWAKQSIRSSLLEQLAQRATATQLPQLKLHSESLEAPARLHQRQHQEKKRQGQQQQARRTLLFTPPGIKHHGFSLCACVPVQCLLLSTNCFL